MAGSQQFDYYYLILAGWFPGGEWLRSNRHVASIARSFHASRYFLFGISQDFWFFCCLSVLNWGHKGDIMWIHYRPKKKKHISKVEHAVILISSPFEGFLLCHHPSCFHLYTWGRSWKRTNRPSNDDASRKTLMGSTNPKLSNRVTLQNPLESVEKRQNIVKNWHCLIQPYTEHGLRDGIHTKHVCLEVQADSGANLEVQNCRKVATEVAVFNFAGRSKYFQTTWRCKPKRQGWFERKKRGVKFEVLSFEKFRNWCVFSCVFFNVSLFFCICV